MLTSEPAVWLTAADLRGFLKKAGTGDDALLTTIAGAACEMIRGLVGEVAQVTAVERRTVTCGGRRMLVTEHRPVKSITSITDLDTGVAIDPADYDLVDVEGVIEVVIPTGGGRYELAYTCERNPIPDNITQAGRELGAHLWRSSQNGGAAGAPQFTGDSDGVQLIGSPFALPIRVRELLGLGRRGTDMPLVG